MAVLLCRYDFDRSEWHLSCSTTMESVGAATITLRIEDEAIMPAVVQENIEIGYRAFVSEVGQKFGAVRDVSPGGLVVYVENAGDFFVPLDAVKAVHSQKVIFKREKLDRRLQEAIRHAHDAEDPDL